MGKYVIRVDSATKSIQKLSKIGPSSAAWITWLDGTIITSGILYFHHHGPNKTFYEGIIAALNQLDKEHFSPKGFDKVTIFGDCEPVIGQIKNKITPIRMKKHFECIKDFCGEHPNVEFDFLYQNESEDDYKKVHILTTQGRSWVENMIKIKNSKN